jgi:integration host factor subunit beta
MQTCLFWHANGERLSLMTKADLIDEVSRLAELTRKDSEVIVETIFDSVVRSLRAGDKIEIRGFGSFRTRQRKPRTGRNPKTGEKVDVPAKKIPFFKPSKELKDLVNEGIVDPVVAPPQSAPTAPFVIFSSIVLPNSRYRHHPASLSFLGAIRKKQIRTAVSAKRRGFDALCR